VPLATKKVIAYIDQNLISNIVKAKEGRVERPDLIALFDVLNEGMRAEKLVCPRSWFHREEGSLTSLDPDIQRYLRYIGQVDFLTPFELEERQFFNAARVFLGEKPYYSAWHECLEDDPDQRLRRFHIDANMPMAIFNFRERRQIQAEELDRARSMVRGRTFKEQLSLERSEVPRYLFGSYPFGVQHLFAERAGGRELLAEFLTTDLATAVVSMDLFTQLCASLLVHDNHRPIQTGDVTDMKILSNLLPYCHVLTTDKFMKEKARVLKLPERFGVSIFAGTVEDVTALTEHIRSLLSAWPAASAPKLSLLVLPDDAIKENLWNFFQRLMLGARRWESQTQEWIELVNVNDGGHPTYEHRSSGLPLPDASFFFEFDDEISSKGRSPRELADTLRGSVVVVVDSYHQLSDDFLEEVVAAVASDSTAVTKYGWPIVRKLRT
jgi:hypothetical protein